MLNKLKKYLPKIPTAKEIRESRSVRWISGWLKNRPYLWRYTKHSVAASVAVSLFVAFLPLPFEMLMVTLLAIWVHANLSIAILSTWLTNPFTLIPANYFSYKVGVWIIHNGTDIQYVPIERVRFHWNNWYALPHDIYNFITTLGTPYLIGLPIVSISVALLSYGLIYLVWSGVELISNKKKSS